MTLEEFKKQCYHTEKHVIVPSLNRAKIDKTLFFKNNRYKPELLDTYLEMLYKERYKNESV